MASPRVLIIGAGVAGLAAGCYAQLNGLSSCIIEQHHLLSIAPEDAQPIRALARGIRNIRGMDMSTLFRVPRTAMSLLDWGRLGLRMAPYIGPTARWMNLSAQDFARRFRNPLLRRAIPHLLGWPEIPVLAGMSMLAAHR